MIGQSAAGQGHEIFNLTEKELLYKQKIGMELLEVANIISPGISRLRGVILYELQATLACYARRKFSAGEISVDHMKNVMKVRLRYDNKWRGFSICTLYIVHISIQCLNFVLF